MNEFVSVEQNLKQSAAAVISRVDVFDYLRTPANLDRCTATTTLFQQIQLVNNENVPIAAEIKVKQMHSKIRNLF